MTVQREAELIRLESAISKVQKQIVANQENLKELQYILSILLQQYDDLQKEAT